MAVVMKAVYDSFGRIVGVETMEVGDDIEVTDSTGENVAIDTSEALPTFDLTTTEEIQMTTTDPNVTEENIGKKVVVGHPIHLDVKAVAADATVASEAVADTDWDGGEW